MDLQDFIEYSQLELIHAKHTLNVKNDIILIYTPEKFMEIFSGDDGHHQRYNSEEEAYEDADTSYGMANTFENYIFLHSRDILTIRKLKSCIWHELLHFKFPKLRERKIKKLTHKPE